ncbi:MAG: 3-oxoacyl-(acyl-carrier-protein) reductase [Phycisphaerales bacterium]|nr:3-oxoacyl-(acyl-carrier-protein) reductase [Phycisphaerales bacterium]
MARPISLHAPPRQFWCPPPLAITLAPVHTSPLQDKVIVVIGGTTGLGLSGAKAIIAAGGRVIAVGLEQETSHAAATALGDGYEPLTADATQTGVAERAIDLALTRFARFDGLYHVAGGSGRRMGDAPLHQATDAGWNDTLRLNLTSMFLSNRAAVRAFLKRNETTPNQPGGVILNMGSVLASSPSPQHFSTIAYAAAKSAIIGMTRSAAAYYAPHNIRFNIIAPGLVDTPMARRAAADDAIMAFVRTKQPLDGGRIAQPTDLDAAVVYLLSDAASFVTAQILAIDGGWSVTEGQYPPPPTTPPTTTAPIIPTDEGAE